MDPFEELNHTLLECKKCPRLVSWREKVAHEKRRAYLDQEYWGKPVPGFGDRQGRVFVIGLAPGAHGSNRTGRQFTGDASGDFLFPALYQAGFSSRPESISRNDGLSLKDLYTAPVCRCVPPGNRPTPDEIKNCQPYLELEIDLIQPKVFVALGRIAFDSILRVLEDRGDLSEGVKERGNFTFSHNHIYKLKNSRWLLASYHPSRQNTQTGKLTVNMFSETWENVRQLMNT
jgi:uracil-DNA glycosylase